MLKLHQRCLKEFYICFLAYPKDFDEESGDLRISLMEYLAVFLEENQQLLIKTHSVTILGILLKSDTYILKKIIICF